MCAALIPQSWHTIRTVGGPNAAICSHSLGIWLAQNRHTVRTLNEGVRGQSPRPTFVAAHAAANIVGHYICEHDFS